MISVIGGENAPPEAVRLAEEVGRELARRGAVVVCGGGSGVMAAVCRGAREEGGHTIGIMPGHGPQETPPNPWVEFPIYTGIGYARNSMVVLSGEAVIAIDGSYGTLSEIAYALIHNVPIVGLETWDFSYAGHESGRIVRARDAREAVELALRLARERRSARAKG